MIINASLNYIFVHVPKTAGQSITMGLKDGRRNKTKQTHEPLFLVDANKKEGKFSFGFVRNPWDRLCSLYHFRAQRPHSVIYDCEQLRQDGFEKSLLNGTLSRQTENGNFNNCNHRDAMWWLHGCDFIGQFEHLQRDFYYICDRIGQERRELKKVNDSNHTDYRNYYTTEMVDFVSETHAETIGLFGYSFENNHSV